MSGDVQAFSALLNRPGHESIAAVAARITVSFHNDKPDGSVVISDCRRSVALTLDGYSCETFENSIYKLDTLIQILCHARDALYDAGPDEWKSNG